MKSKISLFAASLGLLAPATTLMLSSDAFAQSATSGAIQGVVTDEATGEPLAGVTIVVTSPALQGTQSAITDGSGGYKVTNLPPGTYVVTFYYSDVQVRRSGVIININKTNPVYIKLNTAQAGGEVIEMEGSSTIDVNSATQGVTLDQDYVKNIPIPGRTFESALGAAAGSSGDGLGVSFSGSSSLENQYVVDGVNTTGLSYGTVGSPVFNDFIEEIEIITGGYNAEYGRATGGVVNVATKSGTNEFHGDVFTYLRPGFLVADNKRASSQITAIDFTADLTYSADFGATLGGPIIKDRVWFFAGLIPSFTSTKVNRFTTRRTDCRTVMPDGSLSTCDPTLGDGDWDKDPATGFFLTEDISSRELSASTSAYQGIGKINFMVSPEHQGQFTGIVAPGSGDRLGVFGTPEATSSDYSGVTMDYSAKWTSKFNDNKTEVEAVLGWHRDTLKIDSIDDRFNTTPLEILVYGNLGDWSNLSYEDEATRAACQDNGPNDPFPYIVNCPDAGIGYAVGGPGGLLDLTESRLSGKLSATQRVKAAGNHELKAGLDIEQNYMTKNREFSGDVFYVNRLGGQDELQEATSRYIQAQRWVHLGDPAIDARFDETCTDGNTNYECDYLTQGGPGSLIEGNTSNFSAYLRDSWQVMPNLTLNYGLRYEEQRLRYAKELQNTEDPFTHRKLGKNAMVLDGLFAPRVGLVYDWTKEGRSKVYGNWGRFYESVPMDINDRSFGGEILYRQTFSPDQCGGAVSGIGGPSGTGCGEQEGEETASLDNKLFGSNGVVVEPGIKAQYLDEALIGAEYEVIDDLKIGVSYQNRRLGRVIEDVSVDDAATYIIANPGEFSSDEETRLQREIDAMPEGPDRTAAINQLEQYKKVRGFDVPRRDYNALQLIAVRRFTKGLAVQASYTYSRTTGNYQGLFSSDNGQVDPNISSQYDLIELLANREGALPQDRPHYFKLDGWYDIDLKKNGKITPGVRFRALSGTPVDALGRHFDYGAGEAFLLPRAAMGRTAFDYGLDLKLQYERDLARGMSMAFFLDLFNVFNRQGEASVDENYTYSSVNPIVGGEYRDLVWAKSQNNSGDESRAPVVRNPNFLNTTGRYGPFYTQVGLRLSF
jgi:outer membrane receptor protein involved in Fe transport